MKEEKQKTGRTKRGRPATGHRLQGTEQRFHRDYAGQEPMIVEHSRPNVSIQENDDSDVEIAEELSIKSDTTRSAELRKMVTL